MKKSKVVAMMLGVIGTLLFGIGMSMCTIVEWNLFQYGITVGATGLFILLLMVLIYRKMEHKEPILFTKKTIWMGVVALLGLAGLGVGMSLSLLYHSYLVGILIGVVGIMLLCSLVPIGKGIV